MSVRPGQKLCVYCGAKLTQDDEAADYDARSDRNGPRERSQDDHYRPGGGDASGRGDGRSSRRAGGTREESRSRDPLDDPRAPRNLRGTSSSGRSAERGRGSYESRGYDDAEYEYDDYNPRDRTSPRYQPRFDPDSAEYDAVADQRRQSRLRPRQNEARSRGYDRDGGPARGGRAGGAGDWDEPRDRRRDDYGRGQRGATPDPRDGRYNQGRGGGYDGYDGYGDYGGYGQAESAEYPASYDERADRADRADRRDRGMSYSRGGRGVDMDMGMGLPDQQAYGGGWDQYESRGAGGPSAQGWNGGAWAPGADANAWSSPGAGYAPARLAAPAKKRGRGGLIATLLALLLVVVLASGGFLARGKILALLHRGGGGNTSAPPVFATYTPGPTPTVRPNYKLYVNTNAKYIIEYPSAWNIQNDNSTSAGYDYADLFEQQNPMATVGVESAQAFTALSNAQIIQAEINGAKQGAKPTVLTFTQIGSDVTVSVGGESWTRQDYSVTGGNSNSVTLHMAILATHHAGRAYAIVLYSAASSFVQNDSGVFKTMLGTFRFTS